ncbi:hypothetical protein TCAL_08303 [Tigriopus californicus]|uniref:Uncharacterized protein n=1 Tax=Tigriopus californicus TaxID=6832 RepID=A0A553NDL3_TIGCA|nr:placenta-specific gene 8 protein-like [Tigriopus californicus]TRY63546.1 hypothetical protein TCAL_08303 [Tigriopus californicus]|eukprot:TCALIF_08303-PA protein Name:"Similar to cnfn-b Cornifelin homolog B (Xenopus laevis)" AED:0.00 eAED:0.00 QI:73/1/1/1/0/0/3/157/104
MDVVQNEWQQGELQCFKDPMTMLFGWFCSLCLVCKNAKDLGESVPMYCCLSCFCPVVGICLLRQKTRERYGIEGDTTKDVLCSCCCSACVNCQTASEIKAREGL